MKKALRLFTGLICFGLAGISSTPAFAKEKSATLYLAEIKGIRAECQAPQSSFNISYTQDSNRVSFLKEKKRARNSRVNFVRGRSGREIARVFTTSFNGKNVTVREVAVSKKTDASCEFVYKSA